MGMEVKPVMPEEEATPKIAMGIVPCYNEFYVSAAWKIIKPLEENFVRDCLEEYTLMDVWSKIFYGAAFLYMGYLDPTGKVTEESSQAFVIDKLVKNPADNWVGFVLLRLDPNAMFVWQVYIDPKFQNTTAFQVGLEWLKKLAKDRGCPYLAFSTYRKEWEKVAPKIGAVETYTVFRVPLKE